MKRFAAFSGTLVLTLIFCALLFAVSASAVAPIAGDANGDGQIKGNDATLMLKYLADWDVKSEELNSDCNGDGKIKGNDATLLLKYLADWDVELKLSRNFVNLAEWSEDVKTDGSADITSLLQKCINENDSIFIPKGKYLMNGVVSIRENLYVIGEEGTVILSPSGGMFTAYSGANNTKNLTFSDFDVIGNTSDFTVVLRFWSVENVLIDRINVVGTGLCGIDTCNENRTVEDNPGKSKNILVRDCSCDGVDGDDYSKTNTCGAFFYYTDGFTVRNCEFSNYFHGIYWWGDDSNANSGGRYENLGKCQNGLIENCRCVDIRLGGIWGSMGKNITVRNCYVENCDDVGIDFEGCENALAENNYVVNCYHNYTTFMSTTGTNIFRNNISVFTSDSPEHYYMHYNMKSDSLVTYEYQQIIIENNVFRSEGEMGLICAVYNTNPMLGHFIFKNNKLENVNLASMYYSHWIDWTRNFDFRFEVWDTQIIGNEFLYTVSDHSYNYELINEKYFAPIWLLVSERSSETKYPVIVRDNKIITDTPFDAGIIIEHDTHDELDYDIIVSGNGISENIAEGIVISNITDGHFNVTVEDNITEGITVSGYEITVNARNNVNSKGKAVTPAE